MATAQVTNIPERRRSERQPVALPILVRGVSLNTKSFAEETFSLSISANGALLAMTTTVTLGQALYLTNPKTQKEAGGWVTRFGLPRGGVAQVGIEFIHADADFWSQTVAAKVSSSDERRTEDGIHILHLAANADSSERTAASDAEEREHADVKSIAAGGTSAIASQETLLKALEQSLREAAERAVDAAANSRLGGAVNLAAASIENYGRARIAQIEERFAEYRKELGDAARSQAASRAEAELGKANKLMRTRAEEIIEEVRAKIEGTAAELAESRDKATSDMDRTVAECRESVRAMAAEIKASLAESEARVRALKEEIAGVHEQGMEKFRERMRGVLKGMADSLG